MTVNICGIPHKVVERVDGFENEVCGMIDYKKCEIKINKNMSKEHKLETLCHEIIHGIFFHLGYNEHATNEQLVQALGNAIYQSFDIKEIKMKYRPLGMFVKQTDELKELITKYSDYPIVVIVDSEVVADYDYGWWYAPEIRFGIGEILDCEQDIDEEKTYIDRDEFEEDMYNKYEDDEEYEKLDNYEFDEMIENKLKEYEPYWRKVIQIRASV